MVDVYAAQGVHWVRPKDLTDGAPNLWGTKGILPNGVNQGSLGDCWFLAAGAALAEWPDRLQKLFTNTEYPSNGLFEIKFFVKGRQIPMVIDDKLPVDSKGRLMNTKMSSNSAWWMPILEKGFAKLNNDYARMNGGFGAESLRALTG